MNRTFYELCEDLKKLDEITLMELLNLNSEEIVDAFQDKIEDNFERLSKEVNNELEEYDPYE
ncbi:hypothetical protein UFOVP369_4 [uncultured Caudovirales phage]|uniref:Uncharacterized protein n=1 Tax=uncultured Caudovirales phage TaxID=2100421 RepID=A0A6J7X075_9CAUD|nr:hypothetical protein UFOVP369_4 [uncultured Caudovirales phage]